MALALRSPVTEPLHEFGWQQPSSGEQSNDFRITSPFGWRDDPLNPGSRVFHGGVDIGNRRLGYPEVAVADGIVIAAGFVGAPWSQPSPPDKVATWGPTYGGNMVVIRHDAGVISLYAHMATRVVNTGERVTRGQKLGTLGDSGSAYRQGHLHFGLQVGGKWIDPEPHIRLGVPVEIEDDEMIYLPADGTTRIVNRECEIRSGTNYRSRPNLDPETILGTTSPDKQTRFHPIMRYDKGAEANGSRVWYWGVIWVSGHGFGPVFVHASRCTPLTVNEKVEDDALARRLTEKDAAFADIEERAKRGNAI